MKISEEKFKEGFSIAIAAIEAKHGADAAAAWHFMIDQTSQLNLVMPVEGTEVKMLEYTKTAFTGVIAALGKERGELWVASFCMALEKADALAVADITKGNKH